jgi:hypothetical protein
MNLLQLAVVSLISNDIAAFSKSIVDVGSTVGCGLLVISFALLTGTPISGALLDPPRYTWSKAIIFSAVRLSRLYPTFSNAD